MPVKKENLFEISNGKYEVIPAERLNDEMSKTIAPYLEEHGQAFTIKGYQGRTIAGMTYKSSIDKKNGTILISHGFSESVYKYEELIYYFLNEGYDVCIHNHYNHGLSRDGAVSEATHIDSFQSYVDDITKVAKEMLPELSSPVYLYAHSMGGLVGAMFLSQNPGIVKKAVFNAPMFEINRGGLPYGLSKFVSGFLCMIGRSQELLFGQMKFSEEENFEASAASDKNRYLSYFNKQLKNPLLRNGGASCKWVNESLKAERAFLDNNKGALIDIPVILFQAQDDGFVMPGGQERFISQVKNGKILFVPGSKHEIYLSDDETMGNYMDTIFKFLKVE